MIILGISASHDAGAAIIKDGKIISAVNEERLNRKKMYWGFPELSIDEVFRLSKLSPKDIDVVAISNLTMTGMEDGATPGERDKKIYENKKMQSGKQLMYPLSKFKFIGTKTFTKMALAIGIMKTKKKIEFIKNYLKSKGIDAPMIQIEHHKAHAASAFLTSGFERCLTYTSDFMGDFLCCTVNVCDENGIHRVLETPFYHSPGMVYTWITKYLGFTPGKHEGKITGLAAFGKPTTYDIFSKYISLSKDGMSYERNIRGFWYHNALEMFKKDLDGFTKEEIASGLQKRFEDVVSIHIQNWLKEYPMKNVALAGGIFANVKLNQKVLELPEVENIFIHPHMSDGGLAAGAALAVWMESEIRKGRKIVPQKLENVYFGEDYSDEEIQKELDNHGLKYKHYENVEKEIAKLIAIGKVVGRFNGKMEYGPRALGNRSILYQPTKKEVNDWLNKRLKRTEFMPFAPSTIKEDLEKSYKDTKGGEYAAEFMTITFNVTDWFAKKCPAVTHVDGTARPQIVTKEINPSYYKIIKEYQKISGIGTIVNTSYNMHEEPIVCSPDDAIRSFKDGKLDYLAIGNYIAKNSSPIPQSL
ncbi:MAG: carbamoyltransferase C-terminal domain-containing protein [Nanoarchaeota archaeon]